MDQPALEQRWDLPAERRLKPYCVWEDVGEGARGCLSKNPGFKGACAWICGNRRDENCPPRPDAGITNTARISADVGDLS